MDHHSKAVDADIRCRHWIARRNELEERGITGKPLDEAARKAQFWLDRWNKLNGDA